MINLNVTQQNLKEMNRQIAELHWACLQNAYFFICGCLHWAFCFFIRVTENTEKEIHTNLI